MSNVYDKATVELFVNGQQAEAQLEKLRQSAEDLDTQLQAALAAGDNKQATKLQRELDKVNKAINRTETLFKGTGIVLNDLSNTSIAGLKNALKFLQAQLNATRPNTSEWDEYAAQIREVKERILELNGELGDTNSLWGRFKKWSETTWPAIDLMARGYESVSDNIRSWVDAYADMDQEMANVRKFTGMTEAQVAELNEEFKRMDTRTTREDLNKLAQEAGRLGKTSVEDVLGFVRAADKINVALDDLGNGATLTLSKLTGIFGDEARYGTEQSLLKVGSVINELSQNCSASAPFLANFTERLGGVGVQARLTIPQIMGFGAVLDSNSQKVEASATAVSQVLVRMMQTPAKYAKVAGLDVAEFTRLLSEDANAALILFLEALNKAGGMDVLSPMFKDMGETGSRAIEALSTLASNIDAVKAQQLAANEAFEEGTSIDNEFAVQNTTVAAALDKCKNAAHELQVKLGGYLYPIISKILVTGSSVLRLVLSLIEFGVKHGAEVVTVTAAIAAYTAVLKINALWLDRVTIAQNLAKKSAGALAVANKVLTGVLAVGRLGVVALTNAYDYLRQGLNVNLTMQQRWRNAMAKMNFASWSGLVIALTSAFYLLWRRMKEAREEMQVVENIHKAAAAKAAEELVQVNLLIEAAKNENLTLEERHKAITKLNSIIPNYNAQIDETTGKYSASTQALEDYNRALIKKYELEGAKEKLAELGKEKAAATANLLKAQDDYKGASALNTNASNNIYGAAGTLGSGSFAMGNLRVAKRALDKAQNEVTAVETKITKLLNAYGVDLQQEAANSTAEEPEGTGDGDGDGGEDDPKSPSVKDRFAAEKAWRERQEAEARISYAKGETLYSQHTQRMAEIERDYWQLILDRSDLSENERLSTLASYWEAVNKETDAQTNISKEMTEEKVKNENSEYESQLAILRRHHLRRLADESLSAEEREAENARYNEAVELEELMHLKKIRDLYAEGSAERLTAQRNFENKELAARERHLKEMEEREAQFAKIKNDVFGLNQSEKDAEYARQHEALTQVLSRELQAVGDNEAEKLRIKEAFLAAEAELRRKYNQEGAEETSSAYSSAIAKSVEWLRGDGGQALSGALSTVTSGMSSIFSELSSMVQAELDVQTATIESRYNREVQLAQGNSYKIAKLEKKKDAEIAKAKNDANKKMFAMQVIQAVAQTATNALNAYGSAAAIPVVGHIMAPIAAAMAVAAGAVQIAAIKKQQQASQAQGYSKGGFTKPGAVDEPAGIVHAGEWVASQRLLASPVARPMIEALDYAQRTNTIGSLRADDVSRSITAPDSLVRIAEGDGGSSVVVAAALAQSARAVAALSRRLDEPFVTVNTVSGDKGIKAAQDEYSRLMANKSPKTRRNATAR